MRSLALLCLLLVLGFVLIEFRSPHSAQASTPPISIVQGLSPSSTSPTIINPNAGSYIFSATVSTGLPETGDSSATCNNSGMTSGNGNQNCMLMRAYWGTSGFCTTWPNCLWANSAAIVNSVAPMTSPGPNGCGGQNAPGSNYFCDVSVPYLKSANGDYTKCGQGSCPPPPSQCPSSATNCFWVDMSMQIDSNVPQNFQSLTGYYFEITWDIWDSAGNHLGAVGYGRVLAVPAVTESFSYSPSNVQYSNPEAFSAVAAGGLAPYSYSWVITGYNTINHGNSCVQTGNGIPWIVSITPCWNVAVNPSSVTVELTVYDSESPPNTATSSQTIPISNLPVFITNPLSFTSETSTTDKATGCGDTTTATQAPTATTTGNKISDSVDIQGNIVGCVNSAFKNTDGQYEEISGFKSNQLGISASGTYTITANWYLSWQGQTLVTNCLHNDISIYSTPGFSYVVLSAKLKVWDTTTNSDVSDASTVVWSSVDFCDTQHIKSGSGTYMVSTSYSLQLGHVYQFETYADVFTQTGGITYENSAAEFDSSSYMQSLSVTSSSGNLGPPDFSVSTNPIGLSVLQGTTGTSQAAVTSFYGFSSSVSLSSSSQTGIAVSFSPTAVAPAAGASAASSISVSVDATVPSGLYLIIVTGTTATLSHSINLFLVVMGVPDFSISTNPNNVNINAGASGTSVVTISPLNGFTGTVNLASSVSPSAGLSCSLSPTSVILGSSGTSTLSCSGSAGTYSVSVAGTSGILSRSTTVTYTVQGFTMGSSPTSITVGAGTASPSTITASPIDGFGGTVSLAYSVSPSAGLACTLAPNSIVGSGASTLSCNGSVGSYTVTVTGVSGTASSSATVSYAVQGFTLSDNANAQDIPIGSQRQTKVTLTSVNGFSGNVNLVATPSSTSVSCWFTTTTNTATVTVPAGGSAYESPTCAGQNQAGSYTLTIAGTSGPESSSILLPVNITDFSVSGSAVTFLAGSSSHSTVTLKSLFGFSGSIGLTLSTPSGLSGSCPSSVNLGSGETSMAFCLFYSSSPGIYSATVTASSVCSDCLSAGTDSHSISVSVRVEDFSISASSTTVPVLVGQTGAATLSVASLNGFAGTVSLSDTPLPSGLTCNSISPTSITLPPSPASVSLSCSATVVGTYTVTILASSGSLSHTATVAFTVQDFTISISPTSETIIGSNTATSTVTITPINGFGSTVSLTVSQSPSGLYCYFSPVATITGSGSTNLFCYGSAGNYVVTVTGAVGTFTHSITTSITVKDFSISVSPSTINIADGRSGTLSVTATSINGYTGTISLSMAPPYCATYSFSKTDLQLSSGGTDSAILTVSVAQNCLAQAYYDSVNGYDSMASVNRGTTITINTSDFYLSTPFTTFGIAGKNTLNYNVTYYNENNYPSTSIAQSYSFGVNNCCFGASLTPNVSLPQGSVTTVVHISSSSLSVGATTLTISATDGYITRSVTLSLIANNYNVTLMYNPLQVTKGSSTAIYFQIFPYFFIPLTSETIVPTTVPACLTLGTPSPQYFNLGPVNGYSFITVPVSAASTCTTGNYQVTATITGVSNHTYDKAITFTVTVASPPPGGGGGGSVAAGTLITLADGTQVPVQSLKVGMQLLSYDMTTHQYVITTITKFVTVMTYNQMVISTSTGKPLIVDQNPAQKLYVKLPDGTVTLMSVTDLKIGYNLFDAISQTWVPITSIHYENGGQHLMYDIYTSSPGNYIANGYLDPLKM